MRSPSGTTRAGRTSRCAKVGAENTVPFGLTVPAMQKLLQRRFTGPADYIAANPELARRVSALIGSGPSSPMGTPKGCSRRSSTTSPQRDPFLVIADYADYIACQRRYATWLDTEAWTWSILNSARTAGQFSPTARSPLRSTARTSGTSGRWPSRTDYWTVQIGFGSVPGVGPACSGARANTVVPGDEVAKLSRVTA